MILRMTALFLTMGALTASVVLAGREDDDSLREIAEQAASSNERAAEEAGAQLRDAGPAGLVPLVKMREEILQRLATVADADLQSKLATRREKIDALIDRVGGQRYACVSHLYWHTDFEKAKAAAAASGKPILSLRMLGNLTDEFSCANSRFFRTTLYANQEISRRLREHFVLHWKSVRPVPRVTIDFGDGRKLERTLTGNSIHYLLTADGHVLDALPGLYGPQQFLEWLSQAEALHQGVAWSRLPSYRADQVRRYHALRGARLASAWANELWKFAPETAVAFTNDQGVTDGAREPAVVVANSSALATRLLRPLPPSAMEGVRLTAPKASMELPILRQLAGNPAAMTQATTEEIWRKIASQPHHVVEIDAESREVIRRENPDAARAGALAVTKRAVEDPILRLVENLKTSIAVDSVRNEYTLHRQIHEWFAAGQTFDDVEPLNERVYAELFLTPSSDPWLGLNQPDAYTALTHGGVVQAAP